MRDQRFTISGPNICLEDSLVSGKNIIINKGVIEEISERVEGEVIHFPEDCTIIPGMIDCHIHGADGADVMDGTSEALLKISNALYREGATGFLATTMTETPENITNALSTVSDYMDQDENDHIIGVHLEGPFLAVSKMGAQRGDLIVDPDIALFDQYQQSANGKIKLLTIAPETNGAVSFIEHIVKAGVVASIGHTDATAEETLLGIDAGATHATHLFNAMSGVHHREPGAATAILMSKQVTAELIVDGVHLNPNIVKFAYTVKGSDKLVLVTDAMRAKCLGDGQFDLGGQTVTVKGREARLDSGALAGSVLTMNEALQNLIQFTDVTLPEAVRLTSVNPAKILGCFDSRGSIASGKRADLVVLDNNFHVKETFAMGNRML